MDELSGSALAQHSGLDRQKGVSEWENIITIILSGVIICVDYSSTIIAYDFCCQEPCILSDLNIRPEQSENETSAREKSFQVCEVLQIDMNLWIVALTTGLVVKSS